MLEQRWEKIKQERLENFEVFQKEGWKYLLELSPLIDVGLAQLNRSQGNLVSEKPIPEKVSTKSERVTDVKKVTKKKAVNKNNPKKSKPPAGVKRPVRKKSK